MKQWVKDGVAEVAREVVQERNDLNRASMPFAVSRAVRDRRPDIYTHVKRNSNHDPHQIISSYITDDVYRQLPDSEDTPAGSAERGD